MLRRPAARERQQRDTRRVHGDAAELVLDGPLARHEPRKAQDQVRRWRRIDLLERTPAAELASPAARHERQRFQRPCPLRLAGRLTYRHDSDEDRQRDFPLHCESTSSSGWILPTPAGSVQIPDERVNMTRYVRLALVATLLACGAAAQSRLHVVTGTESNGSSTDTAALWIEAEPGDPADVLRDIVRAGPAGIRELAARHLDPQLNAALEGAFEAARACRRR